MLLFDLNNGNKIPAIGSGTNTFGKKDGQYQAAINNDTTEIESAITIGYRHFDTAISYRNESVVAAGIKRSGLDRSEFFLTSKIPGQEDYTRDADSVRAGVKESLKNLDTDTIDLYLIHHPWDDLDSILAVWRVLEESVDQGKLRNIGVSNFNEEQLSFLLENGRIKPAVNQVESHIGKWNDDIIRFSLEHDVVPEAWGPLYKLEGEAKGTLDEIGRPYNKSAAQVILRYQLQRNVVVIPKSHNPKRQAANFHLLDFELSAADIEKIAQL